MRRFGFPAWATEVALWTLVCLSIAWAFFASLALFPFCCLVRGLAGVSSLVAWGRAAIRLSAG